MGDLSFDVRDALRSLRRDPAYAVTVVLTLTLTIGATTAVFSIVNAVLLRRLPYRDPDRLVVIEEGIKRGEQYPWVPVNARHFAEWRARVQSFEQVAELAPAPMTLTGGREPAVLSVVASTGNVFEVLDARVQLGRPLRVEDERLNGEPVVVLTDRTWRDRFGADPTVIGRPVALDGSASVVVGVLARDFRFPTGDDFGGGLIRLPARVDAFVPFRVDPSSVSPRGDYNYPVVGRLKAGISRDRASAELDAIQQDIGQRIAGEPGLKARLTPLFDAVVGRARRGLLLLLAAVGAVLLIACSNLANLSLTRAVSRVRETAIRAALGATRRRLMSRIFIEQTILASCGGVMGVIAAREGLAAFVTAQGRLPRAADVDIDARVLVFAAAVSIASGLLVALVPAWRLTRGDTQASLRSSGPTVAGDRGGMRIRGLLLAAQVALSFTLLVVTALLGLSFARMMRIDRGFSTDRVLAVDVTLPASRYEDHAARVRVYDRVIENVRAIAGVATVAWTSVLPLSGESWVDLVVPAARRGEDDLILANYRFVAPDFFRTLSMPVVRGRALAGADLDPARATVAAVISEKTAARAWPGVDPIGRQFKRGSSQDKPFEVVGVVADGRPTALETAPPLMVYVPYTFRSRTRASLVIGTLGDPMAAVADVRRAVWRVDPEMAVSRAQPLDALVDAAAGDRRYQMTVFFAFGAAALLIATIGVYSVAAYGVSRRRREMNIRLALGARRSQVVGLVVRQGFVPVAAGLCGGVAGALAVGSVIASLLFDVRARDPVVIAATAVVVGAIGLLACVLAARQGLVLNPASALREE